MRTQAGRPRKTVFVRHCCLLSKLGLLPPSHAYWHHCKTVTPTHCITSLQRSNRHSFFQNENAGNHVESVRPSNTEPERAQTPQCQGGPPTNRWPPQPSKLWYGHLNQQPAIVCSLHSPPPPTRMNILELHSLQVCTPIKQTWSAPPMHTPHEGVGKMPSDCYPKCSGSPKNWRSPWWVW